MKRKNHIKTNSIRAIKKALPRFFSLMIMSMLGVFTFSGLQATSPDMLKTLDSYLDNYNTYDIKIISTMGLVENDLARVKEIEEIENVEGSYSKDIITNINDHEFVINVSSVSKNINQLQLLEGHMLNTTNEIVVESNMLTENNLKIGDIINLDDDTFKNREVEIVGTVDSSLYFNSTKMEQSRGNTSVGSGKINYYTYVLAENFDQSYYSSIYVTIRNSKEKVTSSKEYTDLIDSVSDKLEEIKSEQEESRYDNLYNEIEDEITKKEKEANQELDDAKKKLEDARKELDTGKKQLDISKTQLQTFKTQLNQAKTKLNQANFTLLSSKKELNNAKVKIDNAKTEFNNTLKQYNISSNEIETSISNIEKILKQLPTSSNQYKIYEQQLISLKKLNTAKVTIEESEETYNINLAKYNQGNKEYKSGLVTYNNNLAKYNESNNKYQENLKIYNENLTKYQDGLEEYNKNKKEVEEKIEEAKDELKEIEYPSWYIYDRTDYSTYSDYIDDTNSITNLSKLFPTVFFAVAILVSLISMNRMVEEDRLEIGTLKSLGFSNHTIMRKYLLFSFFATIVGCIVGSLLGLTIIPLLIFNIYGMLFDVPNFKFSLNLDMTILSFIIVIICVCGTTVLTVYKVLREKPSDLMRPKAPKNGKRVFLERIKLIWNHINFSKKVTIRNLFRYKKRVLVTIIGIAGCTALMLCGFGIRDAIVDIAHMQYDNTYRFDASVYTNNLKEADIQKIFSNENITKVTSSQMISAKTNNINISLFIAKDNEKLSDIVNLSDTNTEQIVKLELGKVIITDKLSDLTGLEVGDIIEIVDVNNIFYKYEISAIVKNYLGHSIYMDEETYEKSGQKYEPNIIYMNTKEISNKKRDEISKDLLKNDKILNISFKSALMESADNMLKSLNKVVVILIVLAAMLSFVVLYNLSNINITERKREISTLKVLGFYDREVDNYITKENIILTILGIAIGLVLGYFLTKTVISTVEIEKARFIYNIKFISYVYASVLSILFTVVVNIITHFKLKKIDMIESLKSVE